jgi:hypothetical protein
MARAADPSSPLPLRLAPGADPDRAERALRSAGATSVTLLQRRQPQALCRGLVDTRLLETMNHFRVAPLDGPSGLDPQAFHTILTARIDDRQTTLAFRDAKAGSSRPRLEAALVRIPVPVDPERDPDPGWSRQRLHRLRKVLEELDPYGMQPVDTDRYGNTFAWRGHHPAGWTVHAWYLPEQDELRVLLMKRSADRKKK